ncbi:fatty acid synthase [Trichonephila clavipes]|nr:fatty acid synthase [Trichonephila clavipes]
MPDHRIFQRLHYEHRKTRSFPVTRHDDGQRRAVRSPSLEERILNVVADRPKSKTRAVAHHASYDPDDLRGKNIGVFIGNSLLESTELCLYDIKSINDYTLFGISNNQLANRISHIFDFKEELSKCSGNEAAQKCRENYSRELVRIESGGKTLNSPKANCLQDKDGFLGHLVAMDESGVYYLDADIKEMNKEWKFHTKSKRQKPSGPSVVIDTACSSGMMSLYFAVQSILRGEVEAAVVGGVNICLRPGTSINFHKLGALSDESKCKTFDAEEPRQDEHRRGRSNGVTTPKNAKGYARSETIAAIFLQKSDVARRKYASIIHIKPNIDGYKEKGKMQLPLENEIRANAIILEIWN